MNVERAIDAASDQDYVEFEKAIKQEIQTRIVNDPYIQKRKSELDRYEQITNLYKQINNIQYSNNQD